MGSIPPRGPDPLWSWVGCSGRVSPQKIRIWLDKKSCGSCNAARVTRPAYSQPSAPPTWCQKVENVPNVCPLSQWTIIL